ncbi:MAG: PAS domain S-box protein [Methanobacterium sp.]
MKIDNESKNSFSLSENAYYNIFNNMQEIMAIFEIVREQDGNPVDMIIKDVNETYVHSFGIPREKVINQSASSVYGLEFVDNYFKLVQKNPEIGKGKKFETYFPPLDRYYLTTLFKIGTDLYVTLGIDITERKKLEMELETQRNNLELTVQERTEELLESQKKLTKAQKIAHLGNWELNIKTNKLWFSDEVYHILGYDSNLQTSANLQKLDITYDVLLNMIVHPEDREFLDKSFKEALIGNKPYNIEHKIILPDGEERIIHEQAELIYDENGIPVKMSGTIQDVTELKKTERALKESEEKFRQIAENIEEVFWIIDPKMSQIIYISPAYEKIWGRSRQSLYENPRSWIKSIHPEDQEKSLSMIWGSSDKIEEVSNGFEYRVIRPDGEIVWIWTKAFLIKDEAGKTSRITGIASEVTNRKKAEKALKESEEKFREIFNKANDMISLNEMVDGFPGKFIEINEVGFKRLGYTKEEILNMGPPDIVAPENRKEMPENAALLVKNGCNTFEIVHITKDGKRIPIEVNNHLINYKGKKVCLAISRDITERKQMESALKKSEKKFREIFNNANDMITLSKLTEKGMPGKYIEVNDIGSSRLGYSKDEFLQMEPIDLIADECKKDVAKYAVELSTKGHARFEIIHVSKEGKKIPVELNAHIFKIKDESVVLAISRDISERKKSEKYLKDLLNKLSTSNEELEQFAYIISHDLQEPLRTIANFTQLLERRYKGQFDEDADEFMDYIVDASVRMKEMIHDLLEYSRVSTTKENFRPVDLNKLLKNVLDDLKFAINENNAEITYNNLPIVIADYEQISRVFQNFISNAIKFKKEEEPPKINISSTEDEENDEYIFAVSDNGIGIEKQYFDRIFTIFQRLHTQDKYKGSGIGLSIARRIIELHGGRVWVESTLGVGTTFFFTLKRS